MLTLGINRSNAIASSLKGSITVMSLMSFYVMTHNWENPNSVEIIRNMLRGIDQRTLEDVSRETGISTEEISEWAAL